MHRDKWLLTIGSNTQSSMLQVEANKYFMNVIHISEKGKQEKSKSVQTLLEEASGKIKRMGIHPIAIINFGRGTVTKGIENIAKCSEILREKYSDIKIIGPSYKSAKILNDKWSTYQKFIEYKLPMPKTINLNKDSFRDSLNYKELLPGVLKATNLTGGAGMGYVDDIESLKEKQEKYLKRNENYLLTQYIEGIEFSLMVLCLGDEVLFYPIGLKPPTNTSLTHVDNKVKFNGLIREITHLKEEVKRIIKLFNLQGHFTLEGALLNSTPLDYVYFEGATRITGSHRISNASINFNSFDAICKFINNEEWMPSHNTEPQLTLSIPLFNVKEGTEESLKKLDWVIYTRFDKLEELPYSSDRRTRLTVGIKGKDDFIDKLDRLGELSGDSSLTRNVLEELKVVKEKLNMR